MLFWCIVCIIIAALLAGDLSPLPSIKTFITSTVYGWFPCGYIILFIISPILNSFINSCSEKELGKYIIYFYLLSTIGGYILGFTDFNAGMSALSMCGLDLIGAYLIWYGTVRAILEPMRNPTYQMGNNLTSVWMSVAFIIGGVALIVLAHIFADKVDAFFESRRPKDEGKVDEQ